MIRIGDLRLEKDERDAIQRVVDSGRISESKETRAFEDEFAEWIGAKYCIAVSSGTAALMVGLKSLEYLGYITYDARVQIPALTFIATANAVTLCGYEPVFCDVTDRYVMNPDILSEYADVIIPAHLFGFVANVGKFIAQACPPSSIVCEDACEAHGSTIDGKQAGTLSTWGAFSFYVAHTVQAGELGCLVTDNAELATVARRVKAHGRVCACRTCTRSTTGCKVMEQLDSDPRFTCLYPGYNFKTMEFQAAIARVQLGKVNENIERRQENANLLTAILRDEPAFRLPPFTEHEVAMAYPIELVKEGRRNRFCVELEKRGIECRPAFYSIPHQQPAYKKYAHYDTPIADRIGANAFYVGCHQYLTIDDVCEIANTIIDVERETR